MRGLKIALMDLSGFRVEEMVIGEHFSHRKHTKFSVEY
jgi:hypothetical protein